MSGMGPDDETLHLAGLAGLYALDALEGDDLERFEALLATSDEVSDEVAGFRATAARLAEVSATPAPAGLRDRVMNDVARTRQMKPVVPLIDRRSRRGVRTVALSAAAAVLLLLAGLTGYLVADRGADEQSQVGALLAQADTRVVPLNVVDTDRVVGHVVVSAGAGTMILVAGDMPDLADGRTYELWKLDDEGAHQAGLFEPDSEGRVEATMNVDLDGTTGFAITDEPAAGSAAPTTPILMTASLA